MKRIVIIEKKTDKQIKTGYNKINMRPMKIYTIIG